MKRWKPSPFNPPHRLILDFIHGALLRAGLGVRQFPLGRVSKDEVRALRCALVHTRHVCDRQIERIDAHLEALRVRNQALCEERDEAFHRWHYRRYNGDKAAGPCPIAPCFFVPGTYRLKGKNDPDN